MKMQSFTLSNILFTSISLNSSISTYVNRNPHVSLIARQSSIYCARAAICNGNVKQNCYSTGIRSFMHVITERGVSERALDRSILSDDMVESAQLGRAA